MRGAATGDEEAGGSDVDGEGRGDGQRGGRGGGEGRSDGRRGGRRARGGDGIWAARDGVGGRATTATARRRGAAWRRRRGGEDELNEKFHKC